MPKEKNQFPRKPFDTNQPEKIGILLANLGTPDRPDAPAVRRYLAQFLHDWRVIEITRWLWCPILHFIILRTRPKKVAQIYQSIWWKEGSPLLVISQRQAQKLQQNLNQTQPQTPITIEVGMSYGNPSIPHALAQLKKQNAQKIIILPMYPQYSGATTASTFDAVFKELKKWRWMPELRLIRDYYWHPKYIQALAESVKKAWQEHSQPEKLVISFHGTPERFRTLGDPYYGQCKETATQLANALELTPDQWLLTFQSQFGNDPWIKPATDASLEKLAKEGTQTVDVICPGFSADCIETLEEIEQENREVFESNGGKTFHYIPALNDNETHIQCLTQLVQQHIQGWVVNG
jgi:ferrochelatase